MSFHESSKGFIGSMYTYFNFYINGVAELDISTGLTAQRVFWSCWASSGHTFSNFTGLMGTGFKSTGHHCFKYFQLLATPTTTIKQIPYCITSNIFDYPTTRKCPTTNNCPISHCKSAVSLEIAVVWQVPYARCHIRKVLY